MSTRANVILGSIIIVSLLMGAPSANAAGFAAPEECRAYEGDAHLNCLYAYIEIQKEKLGGIERELQAQKEQLNRLDAKVDRQASAPAAPPPVQVPAPQSYAPVPVLPPAGLYGYPPPGYWYPSPGVSLFFGVPRYPYPYVGPHRHWPRRW